VPYFLQKKPPKVEKEKEKTQTKKPTLLQKQKTLPKKAPQKMIKTF
jgi:hypothetical protein